MKILKDASKRALSRVAPPSTLAYVNKFFSATYLLELPSSIYVRIQVIN